MTEILTASNFLLFAAKHYENPIIDDTEFLDDVNRFKYIKRLLSRYNETGDLKERLILNHIIVAYNCFGDACTKMFFFKLQGQYHLLKPFLVILNRMPEKIEVNGHYIYSSMIPMDPGIVERLRNI